MDGRKTRRPSVAVGMMSSKDAVCRCVVFTFASCLLVGVGTVALFGNVIRDLILESADSIAVDTEAKPLILDWTWFFWSPMLWPRRGSICGGGDACRITWDRNKLREAAAVVFHIRDLWFLDLPPLRATQQRYVFFLVEPPFLTWTNLKKLDGFFNWTMSHRVDGDILSPYGYFVPRAPSSAVEVELEKRSLRKTIEKKSKGVAWFVSRCETPSKREEYVRELQKWIPVDVYGNCGPLSCPRAQESACDAMLEDTYKFYLGFENSVCKDYVTEKLLDKMRRTVVPVVLSRSVAERVAPNNSFIAADDFQSPKALAQYLIQLGRDTTAYEKYFDWRQRFELGDCGDKCGFCRLCKMLREGAKHPSKSWNGLHEWWHDGATCKDAYGRTLINANSAAVGAV